jgi:hypothetical protein
MDRTQFEQLLATIESDILPSFLPRGKLGNFSHTSRSFSLIPVIFSDVKLPSMEDILHKASEVSLSQAPSDPLPPQDFLPSTSHIRLGFDHKSKSKHYPCQRYTPSSGDGRTLASEIPPEERRCLRFLCRLTGCPSEVTFARIVVKLETRLAVLLARDRRKDPAWKDSISYYA